jgi:uncharacterized protein (DUF433 family)
LLFFPPYDVAVCGAETLILLVFLLSLPADDILSSQSKMKMNDTELLARITTNPAILGGKPVIRDTRLSVEFILNLLAHGTELKEILAEYNGLRDDDIQACLLFASKSLSNASFMPLIAESV